MADRQIKIQGTGDFSQLIRSAKEVRGVLQNTLSKNGIQLFDKASIDFMKNYSRAVFGNMQSEMHKLVKEAKELDKILKSTASNEFEHTEAVTKRLQNVKRMSELHNQMQKGGGGSNTSNTGGGSFSKVMGRGISNVAGAAGLGGFSSIVNGGVGAGMEMGAALGGLVAAFAGLALIVNEVVGAFTAFERQAPNILRGRAIGIGGEPGRWEFGRSAAMGFDVDALMSQRLGIAGAFGSRRSSGAQGNILGNIQSAGRGLGLDPMEIIGAGNQLRGNMGVNESSKMLHLVLSKAMAEGMDKSQASHFLSTTVSLLTDINKSGLQSTAGFVTAMAALTAGNRMPPEMAARALGGIQGAITGGTGENAQFFRFAAARAGIGRGTMMGSIFATQQGLTGINPQAFARSGGNASELKMLQGMGLVDNGNYTQSYAKGILGQLNSSVPNQNSPEGFAKLISFMEERFGSKTPAEAIQTKHMLEKLATGGIGGLSEIDKKKYEDLGKTQDQKFQEQSISVMNTIAGNVLQVNATLSNTKFELGKEAAAPMIALKEAIIGLDNTIIDIFGIAKTVGNVGGSLLDTAFSMVAQPEISTATGVKKPETVAEKFFVMMVNMLNATADKTNKLLEEGNIDRKKSVKNNPPIVNRNK